MKCWECGGKVDESRFVKLQRQKICKAYPCKCCGRLHWGWHGFPVANRRGKKGYLFNGKVVYK